MLTVRDLMMPDPLTLAIEDTLRAAAELLTTAGISGAPVVAGGLAVGMVSLTDIVAFEAEDPGVPPYRPELPEPFDDIVPEEADGHGDAVGWFASLWQESEAEVGTRIDTPDGPEWDPLDEHTVSEVMSPLLIHIDPLMPIGQAARLMEKEHIHRVVVLDKGVAVGILSASDIVRAVAQGRIVPAGPGPTLIL